MQKSQPDKRNAPGHHTEGASKNFNSTDTSVLRAMDARAAEKAADVAVRCAWLRVHADLLREVDPSGQLTAQLYDFADLLEVAHRLRWFE